jgi:hypothetical protein
MMPLQGRTRRWLLFMGVLVAAIACRDTVSPREMRVPASSKQISDGAHGGPNDDVFFLPPMVGNPSGAPGYGDPFQPNLPVMITVCERDAGDENCTPRVVLPPTAAKMSLTDQMYSLNWDTKAVALDTSKTYQIQVWIGAVEIAFADVDAVATGAGLKRVDTGDFIGLVDGRTLPIKVRIEQGWNCKNNKSCVTQVVSASATTSTLVETNDLRAAAVFPPGTLPPGVDHVIVTIEDVTPNLTAGETCKNPTGPVLTTMVVSPQCFKFTTDPKIAFQKPVTVATCVDIIPERSTSDPLYHTEQLIKYDVGEPTRFLLNVAPPITCPPENPPPSIGSRSSNPLVNYALANLSRAGRAVLALLTPKPAYAIHLGVGGLIPPSSDGSGGFSYITAGFPISESSSSGDGQTGTVGTALAQQFKVLITSQHSNLVPVPNEPVRCHVTFGGGNFGNADTATVLSGADGIAACPILTLGPTAGTNTVSATALNIDDGVAASEDFGEGPFPVTLRGVVTFNATANAISNLVLFGVNSVDDGLSFINPSNGNGGLIGPLGAAFTTPINLASHPSTGLLYAYDNTTGSLLRVDKCTGAGTQLNGDAVQQGTFNAIAFRSDGTLFGVRQVPPELQKLDVNTGFAIDNPDVPADQAKPLTINGQAVAPSGLAFGPDGTLYTMSRNVQGSNSLFTIDINTGAMTPVGILSPSPTGLPQALAFDGNGNLFGTTLTQFFNINPTTAAVSNLNTPTGNVSQGIAFSPPTNGCIG